MMKILENDSIIHTLSKLLTEPMTEPESEPKECWLDRGAGFPNRLKYNKGERNPISGKGGFKLKKEKTDNS